MSEIGKFFVIIGMIALVAIIGIFDITTGFIPDVTILYLIPIVATVAILRLSYGLFIVLVASAAEIAANIYLGADLDVNLILDAILHFLAFLLGAVVADRLLNQLRIITELERKRSYDLEIAKEIHGSIFTPFPADFRDLAIGSRIAFARELGGDYYHFSSLNDKLFFCIGDISGKGVAAALFSTLLHQNITDALKHSDDLAVIVEIVNARMHAVLPDNMFVTLFCSFIGDEQLDFINAGHEPALLYSKRQDSVEFLQSETPFPIGIRPDLKIESKTGAFTSGDILLGVTDGVTGSTAFQDSPFERLEMLLRKNLDAGPQDITDAIFNAAAPGKMEPPSDDIIIACIKRKTGSYEHDRTNS